MSNNGRGFKRNLMRGIRWGMYDFANSGYFLVYSLLMFPLYLSSVVMKDDIWFEAKWGFSQGASVAVAVLVGVLFGKALDTIGMRAVSRVALVAPAALSFVLPILVSINASATALLIAYVAVHSLYLLSLTIYDSSLSLVTQRDERLEVSSWAWGWGYMGGLSCMGLMQFGLIMWDRYTPRDFATGSVFYLVFAVLGARQVTRLLQASTMGEGASSNTANIDSEQSVEKPQSERAAPCHEVIPRWKLLLFFVLIVDGIAIFMGFFSIFADRIAKLPESEITTMLAVLQVLAFPLTGLMSLLGRRSIKFLLICCGFGWASATAVTVTFPDSAGIWISVLLVSTTVGTTQAVLRTVYAATVSRDRAIREFSLYAVVEKGAAFLGPTLAGLLIVYIGHRAVLALAGLMVFAGCVLVARAVGLEEG